LSRLRTLRPGSGEGGGRERTYTVLGVLLLVALLAVVVTTFRDYGITVDEGVQHRYGRRIVRWYQSLGADDEALHVNNLYLYGGFFELAAQAAIEVLPVGVYDARHLCGALFGVIGVVAVWGLGRQLGGGLAGLLSGLFLALTPSYYGHFFANPKDLPFASLFAAAAWAGLWASRRLRRLGWREVLVTGGLVGLAAGVRVAGIVLFAEIGTLWLGCLWLERHEPRATGSLQAQVRSVALSLAGVVVVGWAVMLAFWPWAQTDPLLNPLRAFREFSHFWETAGVFHEGRVMLSGELPRSYVPRMLALTLPEFYALSYVLGATALLARIRGRRQSPLAPARLLRLLWVAALAVVPVAWIVVQRTPLYNGIRHVLFVVPFLAVVAGTSVALWLLARPSRAARAVALAALGACLVAAAVEAVRLHPYEYVYYNRLFAGGLPAAARRYETDYMCASYKEGIEWMAREYIRDGYAGRLRVDGYCSHVPFWYYLGRTAVDTTHVHPHVMFATTSMGDDKRTDGRVLHVVEREGVPLLYVFEQRTPPWAGDAPEAPTPRAVP
jgi:hypothetical protein